VTFNRTVGKLALPTTDANESTLASLDPAQDILLELFKAAINEDLGPAWDDASTGTTLEGRCPVETIEPFEPTLEFMQQVKVTFPALFVFPMGEPTGREFSLNLSEMTQQWGVDYILGPFKIEDVRKLGGALRVVQKIISEICRVGSHPAYGLDANEVQANQVIVGEGEGTCGFKSFRYVGSTPPGQASFGEGAPTYWATRIVCESTELGDYTDSTIGTTHSGLRFFAGTGTGVPEDDGTGDDDNGIIEEQFERVWPV
jgi:hypothetical protein